MREFFTVVFFLCGLSAAFFLIPRQTSIALLKESGPVENAQFLLYLVGAVVSWTVAARGIWKNGLLGGTILAVFALRELDIQTAFTSMSVTKTRFFISPDVPVQAKLIAGVAFAAIAYIVFRFTKNAVPAIRSIRAKREAWVAPTLTGVVLIPVSLVLDGTERYLKSLGVEYGETTVFVSMVLEEMSELGIPLMFLTSLFLIVRTRKPVQA